MKRGVQEGLGPGHVVLDRDPAPPKKFAQSPNFRPMSVVAKRLDGLRYHLPLGMEVGLGRGNFVLDGDPAPPPLPPKGGHIPPQFSAYVYYGQTAGWSKMPLSTEVGLGPGDNVLDGDRAPPNRAQPPKFFSHVYCRQTAGWIKLPLSTEVGLGPGHRLLVSVLSVCLSVGPVYL